MKIGTNIYTAIGLFATCGLMILGLLATCPAAKAYEKGRNFTKWYIFSVCFFPLAFIAAYVIKAKESKI